MDDRYNRATLRNFFADGQRPNGKHFGRLIDSMLNMVDEGFSKTPQDGLKIASAVTHQTLLSFYVAGNDAVGQLYFLFCC